MDTSAASSPDWRWRTATTWSLAILADRTACPRLWPSSDRKRERERPSTRRRPGHRRGNGSAEELPGGAGPSSGREDRRRYQQLLSPARWPHCRARNESTTTSELLQAHLPTSKIVKAFNHIYAAELTTDGRPAGTKNRRALVIAGDDPAAKATVARLLDEFGFDAVDAGPLKEGWRIQRDTPGYGPRRTAEELRQDLAAAKRYADE